VFDTQVANSEHRVSVAFLAHGSVKTVYSGSVDVDAMYTLAPSSPAVALSYPKASLVSKVIALPKPSVPDCTVLTKIITGAVGSSVCAAEAAIKAKSAHTKSFMLILIVKFNCLYLLLRVIYSTECD